MASAISTQPNIDFGFLNNTNYVGMMDSFMEIHEADRDERVIRTLFDLSNNRNVLGDQTSYGDFTNSVATCQEGGCGFIVNDGNTAFGSRFRGFINVPEDWVDRDIHFGLFFDDSISLIIYNRDGVQHPVYVLAPQNFFTAWRVTDTVVFEEAGLYPIELHHVEGGEHAALELSYLIGIYPDFERPADQDPVTPLNTLNFQLVPETMFFQTLSGVPSFPDPDDCQQCNRSFVNLPGNNGCDAGYYCNEAALCAPCDSAVYCGPTCQACGGATPNCANPGGGDYQCVECVEDEDCEGGFTCNPDTFQCNECIDDYDCPQGEACVAGECTPCGTSDSCAGNSCNCCPTGADGAQLECASIGGDGTPVCMECLSDGDCAQGVCDETIGRCVDSVGACGSCPADFPFCLQGTLGAACAECRFDTDCNEGEFCESGECRVCNTDRRCGARCESCAGAEPYCRDGGTAELSICVQCENDSHCPGSSCDLTTNRCEPQCSVTCDGATPFCIGGDTCVECYADVHCPCNGACDLASNTCNSACRTNRDCMGTEHCAWNDDFDEKECKLGPNTEQYPCSPLSGCIAPLACDVAVGHRPLDNAPSGLILALLGALGLLVVRRRRTHCPAGGLS